jgi:hypothetical protein
VSGKRGGGYEIELFIVMQILIRKLIHRLPARTPECSSRSTARRTNGKKTYTGYGV